MGGSPIIEGHRIRVADIIGMRNLYGSVAGVRRAYPHLTRPEIDAALEYYNANKDEIDRYIAEEDALNEEMQKRQRSS
jgi:uncharacterized protein (DUF433 family)